MIHHCSSWIQSTSIHKKFAIDLMPSYSYAHFSGGALEIFDGPGTWTWMGSSDVQSVHRSATILKGIDYTPYRISKITSLHYNLVYIASCASMLFETSPFLRQLAYLLLCKVEIIVLHDYHELL